MRSWRHRSKHRGSRIKKTLRYFNQIVSRIFHKPVGKLLSTVYHKLTFKSPLKIGGAIFGVVAAFGIGLFFLNTASGANISATWNFSNSSDYTYDTNTTSVATSNAALKGIPYTSDANTAALYHFDETSGDTITDSSSNANNGVRQGNSTFTTGIIDGALNIGGYSDGVRINDSATLSLNGNDTTFEAWVKLSTVPTINTYHDQTILDKGMWRLYQDSQSKKLVWETGGTGSAAWTKQAGSNGTSSWSHAQTSAKATITDGSDVYVGTSNGTASAVWKSSNGGDWQRITPMYDGWSWATSTGVSTLFIHSGTLYVGTNDGYIYTCTLASCTTFTQMAGGGTGWSAGAGIVTGISASGTTIYAGVGSNVYGATANTTSWTVLSNSPTTWGGPSYSRGVSSVAVVGTTLYASINNKFCGETCSDYGTVYSYSGSGTSWTQVGGNALNSSWCSTTSGSCPAYVNDLTVIGSNLYIATGGYTDNENPIPFSTVYSYNGTSWTQIGGASLNSSWTNTAYLAISQMTTDGTNLYVGTDGRSSPAMGNTSSWKYNGTSWIKIGDWTAGTNGSSRSIAASSGTAVYIGLIGWDGNGYRDDSLLQYNGSSWTTIGGGGIKASWGFSGMSGVASSTVYNGKLYVGTIGTNSSAGGGNGYGGGQIWFTEAVYGRWSMIGGQGVKGSGPTYTYRTVTAMTVYGGKLIAAFGDGSATNNYRDVYSYDGTSWTQIGGDGLNSGWDTDNAASITSMTVYGGDLYASMGSSGSTAQGEIYRYNGTSWSRVAGGPSGTNSSWSASSYARVASIQVHSGSLYANVISNTTGTHGIWRFDGSTWTSIGNLTVNGVSPSGVTNTAFTNTTDGIADAGGAFTTYNGNLIATVATTQDATSSSAWSYNGSTWTKIGGESVASSWASGRSFTLQVYGGKLYTGIQSTSPSVKATVWTYDGSSWSQSGNDWTSGISAIQTPTSLVKYSGGLYVGLATPSVPYYTNPPASEGVGLWIKNDFPARFETSSQINDTNWHHISLMRAYDSYECGCYQTYLTIDGSSAGDFQGIYDNTGIVDNTFPLRVGNGFGGSTQDYFDGKIDEVRLSTSFRGGNEVRDKPYATTQQTITLASAAYTSGIKQFISFSAVETANGGSVNYQLSNDNGSTWQYWNGTAWTVAGSLNNANSASVAGLNIDEFTPTLKGLKWRAILLGDGNQQVALNSMTIEANQDIVAPSPNAQNISANHTNGGATLAENAWTNSSGPYLSWDAATDVDSSILGYCLYLGHDDTANPISTKGLLGTSPIDTSGLCQYAVAGTSIDLAVGGILGTALSSSAQPYYLRIKAIDIAGNITPSSAQFAFRFDNTPPTNTAFVSAPAGFVAGKDVPLTWPSSGANAPSDAASGVAGLQYRIGPTGTWYGDAHNGTESLSDVLANDGSYTTDPTVDYPNLNEGNNILYFRTVDQAGNISVTFVTTAIKINTSAPSQPQNLTATPVTNTTNSFAFSWVAPSTFVGQEANLTYCYTINTLPTINTCSFVSTQSLAADAYATQPGENTIYIVAKDESGNINYATYATTSFTANTSAPGVANGIDVADISIKATSSWKLALSWETPTEVGAGVSKYTIYRSTDGTNYTQTATTSGTSYVDSALSQVDYSYKIKACDSANNCGAFSSVVSKLPTGRFTEPPLLITNPSVNVSTRKASFYWVTDRESDSRIQYSTRSDLFPPVESLVNTVDNTHSIELNSFEAGTLYYYRVKWTDEDGNVGSSNISSFTTLPAPVVKNVQIIKTTLNSAVIRFTSIDANRINLYYGKSDNLGAVKSVNTSSTESTYDIELTGLDDGSTYSYKLTAFDADGNEYDSRVVNNFTTPERPRINNLRFQPVSGEPTSTQKVSWTTNVPTDTLITYGLDGNNGRDIYTTQMTTNHELVVSDLQDDSNYFLIAQGRDVDGNLAVSDRQLFKTALDTRPPKISDVNVETSVKGNGSGGRGQIIVSWKTDEFSTSQVAYSTGSAANGYTTRTAEDTRLTTDHIVIISDLPISTVYHLQPISNDKAQNRGQGQDQSAIVGRATESILDIILNSLNKVFGF